LRSEGATVDLKEVLLELGESETWDWHPIIMGRDSGTTIIQHEVDNKETALNTAGLNGSNMLVIGFPFETIAFSKNRLDLLGPAETNIQNENHLPENISFIKS
jgi:hypothetical protein